MKLHSVHGEFAMAECHNFSVIAFCGDFETHRQRTSLHNERVISAGLERRGQIGKETVPVMRNRRCLPMHQSRSAHDFSAICFGDALMSQANTQNWSPWAKRQNDVFTDPCFARCARAWR